MQAATLAPIWMVRPERGDSLALTGNYDNLRWLTLITYLASRGLHVEQKSLPLPQPSRAQPPAALVVDALNRTAAQIHVLLRDFTASWPHVPVYITGRAAVEVAGSQPPRWKVRSASEDDLANRLATTGDLASEITSGPERLWWQQTSPERRLMPCGTLGVIDVEATRGCQFTCSFCSVDMSHSRRLRIWSPREPHSVVREIAKLVAQTGMTRVQFVDDNFLGSPSESSAWARELAALIRRAGLDISFSIYTRLDQTLLECLPDLRSAGLRQVHGGVESGSDSVLRRLRKGLTTAEIGRVIDVLRREQVDLVASLIVFEFRCTYEELRETLEWIELKSLDRFFSLTKSLPYRGTPLADELAAESGMATPFLAADGTIQAHPPYFRNAVVGELYSAATVWEAEHGMRVTPCLEDMMRYRFRYEAAFGFLSHPHDPAISALRRFRHRQIKHLLALINSERPA